MLPTLPNVRAPRLVRHPGGVDGPIHAELELDDLGALRIRKLMRETRLRGFFVCIRCVDYVCVDLHDAYVDPPPTLLHADDAIVCTDPESVICKKCATASAKAEAERILKSSGRYVPFSPPSRAKLELQPVSDAEVSESDVEDPETGIRAQVSRWRARHGHMSTALSPQLEALLGADPYNHALSTIGDLVWFTMSELKNQARF